jgi:hypothetical protein
MPLDIAMGPKPDPFSETSVSPGGKETNSKQVCFDNLFRRQVKKKRFLE